LWSAESFDARLLLAEALVASGETAAAQVQIDRALQLAPESADAKALRERIQATPPK
jgi:Tfp pilus assembly protein PilF